ncbi:MAG: tryptophan synthase subunit alpha, partial [Lachnospiraceae bacterium]|nr:tryptophan synthase subunit alpha [Lachnospiraceae bacterium]
EIKTDLDSIIGHIREVTDTPCAIGFGISTPDQAKAMAAKSDGAIVGSAIVRIVAEHGKDAGKYLYDYVKSMKDAVLSI